MAFTVRDFRDLIQLLSEHPEWREELRRALLSDDFQALPQIVRELAEAQRRTEQRLEELAAAQRRTEQRLEELAEAQRRTEQRLEELAAAQGRTEQRLEELAEAQKNTEKQVRRLTNGVSRLDGRMLEMDYERKAHAYFGRLIRRAQVVKFIELERMLEGILQQEEIDDLLRLDLVVRGQLRQPWHGQELADAWLAVEVSAVVDREDVERASRRAAGLRKAGVLALPVAAGEQTTEGAIQSAEIQGVILMTDGRMMFDELALQRHL